MAEVPSYELFNSCQMLLDGVPDTGNDGGFTVLSALLAAGGELEEMALERLAAGHRENAKRRRESKRRRSDTEREREIKKQDGERKE